MHEDDQAAVDGQYGAWTWIIGLLFGFAVMAIMFGLATGSR